ncbi:hypothetical protein BC827DRAFT_484387 [Russula dissimulans]|nr:hypothetical protein BC827DRAFT_484387 [Russula dissimulans]
MVIRSITSLSLDCCTNTSKGRVQVCSDGKTKDICEPGPPGTLPGPAQAESQSTHRIGLWGGCDRPHSHVVDGLSRVATSACYVECAFTESPTTYRNDYPNHSGDRFSCEFSRVSQNKREGKVDLNETIRVGLEGIYSSGTKISLPLYAC